MAWLRRSWLLISIAGAALTLVGLVGLVADWGSTPASARTVTTSTAERPRTFFASFTRAVRTDDTAFLKARLDPAVLDRYGATACGRAVKRIADIPETVRLVSVSGPVVWTYATDGKNAIIPNTYVFHVTGTEPGKSGTRDLHFALSGGTFHLFTDCGKPSS